MMKNFSFGQMGASIVLGAVVLIFGPIASASEASAPSTAELMRRLDDLEQQVADLRRQLQAQNEATANNVTEPAVAAAMPVTPATATTAATALAPPVITASDKDGFTMKSSDDAFKLKVGGYFQTDGRFFTNNDKSATDAGTTDIFTMRRVRPSFSGTVQKNFDFVVSSSFDAGTASLQDAWLEYRYLPEIKIRAGQFKAPFGLERLQSNANTNFAELTYPTGLTPNYDTGLQISGDLWGGVMNYAVALTNGTTDGAASFTDINNDKEVTARVMFSPFKLSDQELFKGFSGGAAVSAGHAEGAALPTLRSPGQASIFTYNSSAFADGPHTRFSPQISWYYNQFGLLSEYVTSTQEVLRGAVSDKFTNTAWAITGAYVVTGEAASYKGVTPLKSFDPASGGWGAWELVGRYHELKVDDTIFDNYPTNTFANANSAVRGAHSFGFGSNWYLNRNVKIQFDFEHTDFDGGSYEGSDAIDRVPEDAFFTRFQLSY